MNARCREVLLALSEFYALTSSTQLSTLHPALDTAAIDRFLAQQAESPSHCIAQK